LWLSLADQFWLNSCGFISLNQALYKDQATQAPETTKNAPTSNLFFSHKSKLLQSQLVIPEYRQLNLDSTAQYMSCSTPPPSFHNIFHCLTDIDAIRIAEVADLCWHIHVATYFQEII
jgi:hypothetical protein